jgi:hypothetical protein
VPPDLSSKEPKTEIKEEGNLLIDAVSLLVQRQRETETWVSEQIWHAEERAAETERRYAELESRLADIEAHLARLVHDVEPSGGDAVVDERLARLREQLEGLKSVADGHPTSRGAVASRAIPADEPPPAVQPRRRTSATVTAEVPRTVTVAESTAEDEPVYERRVVATRRPVANTGIGFWDLLGDTREDRAGVLLIGAGAVAVLYAILLQLRFA